MFYAPIVVPMRNRRRSGGELVVIPVEGMGCQGCILKVERALRSEHRGIQGSDGPGGLQGADLEEVIRAIREASAPAGREKMSPAL